MSKWWEDYDWRFVQTNLREIDMADIDSKRYVQDMKKFHATVAMINAAGIIASYPTKLKYHTQSPYLTGDSLADIIEECHGAGIKVLARTDFSKIRRAVYEERPEWAYRTADGGIVDYEGDVHACINGGYQSEYALEIIRECITVNDFDGIFFNMGGYQTRDYAHRDHGLCHCVNCQKRFMEMYGIQIPAKADMNDPAYRTYRRFTGETSQAHNERVARFIKGIRPDILVNADTWTEETGMIRQESNTALDRALPHWQYSGSENSKWVRGSYKGFISSNCTVDFIDFPARHTAVSPVTQETRLWQNIANAGHMDYYLIGRLDNHEDQSGYEGIIRAFAFHEKHKDLYRDNESVADIALITPNHWGGFGDNGEAAGLYRALTEGHFLFDVVLLGRLCMVDLTKYKTLILPGLSMLGDAEAALIDAFAEAGGRVLATGRTGFLDGFAERRKKPPLACTGMEDFGVTQSARGAYFRLDAQDHEAFGRFADVNLVHIDGDYVYAAYREGVRKVLRMIPPQPFGPPERCYPLHPAGDNPAAAINGHGKGLCVSIPWNPGALFHRQGYPNTASFLMDVLEGLLDVHPIRTDAPPMVEVTLLTDRAKTRHLLHFVNQTGHFGNSFYPPVTLPLVRCAVPVAERPKSARALIAGRELPFTFADGLLRVEVENLSMFEAVCIES